MKQEYEEEQRPEVTEEDEVVSFLDDRDEDSGED
jgi:hypothetical protein